MAMEPVHPVASPLRPGLLDRVEGTLLDVTPDRPVDGGHSEAEEVPLVAGRGVEMEQWHGVVRSSSSNRLLVGSFVLSTLTQVTKGA